MEVCIAPPARLVFAPMHLSKALRRLVASVVAVLFLACQGMAAVYASLPLGAPQPGSATAQESCHDLGRQSGANDNARLTQCQSQYASSQPIAQFFSTDDLLATAIVVAPPVAVADTAVAPDLPPLGIEPPPLRILNCCLRN